MLTVRALNEKYSNELAEILSADEKLHKELSPNSKRVIIDGIEYLKGCMKWADKKRGKCFAIVKDTRAIGSISFSHKDEKTASIGYWIKSNIASKRLWENYNAIFQEDTERYYPTIDLSQINKYKLLGVFVNCKS